MRWNNAFALILGLGVTACGGQGGTLPTAATSPGPTSSAPFMKGTVSDTAFHNIDGATIEILNGPSAGLTTTSGGGGQWAFPPGAFDDSTQFRATKDGYDAAIMPLGPFCAACNPNRWVNFVLKAHVMPANIAGSYAMTITVDPACTNFPAQVKTRTYAVTVPATATNAYFLLSPTGANFVPGWDVFDGGVSGSYVGFWFETLVEEVAPGNYLMIGMSAGGFVDPDHPATIVARGDGRISYCTVNPASGVFDGCLRGQPPQVAHCDSTQHTLVLTPR